MTQLHQEETKDRALIDAGWIELWRRVDNLLMLCDQQKPPVDLHRLAQMCGVGEIVESAKGQSGREGLLIPTKTGFRIEISADLPPSRKRSTLAHELGHTFLYDLSSVPPTKKAHWFVDPKSEEGVCSEIGRRLLVPKFMLAESMIHVNSGQIHIGMLDELATEFGVSLDVIARRLQDESFCDAVFIFLKFEPGIGRLVPQIPMLSSGALRVKGICAFVSSHPDFILTAQHAVSAGSSQCKLKHPAIGDLTIGFQRISRNPIRVLSLTTRGTSDNSRFHPLESYAQL